MEAIQAGEPFKSERARCRCQRLRQKDSKDRGPRMAGIKRIVSTLLICGLLAGCRCCPLLDHYANTIDDISDCHVHFDNWYCPRHDISRAGKPDWCSPLKQRLCSRCCTTGCWDQYDDCHLYPPSHPYEFPSFAFSGPMAAKTLPLPPQPMLDVEAAAESLMIPQPE